MLKLSTLIGYNQLEYFISATLKFVYKIDAWYHFEIYQILSNQFFCFLEKVKVENNDAADYSCPLKVNSATKAAEEWGSCQLDSCTYGTTFKVHFNGSIM